VAVVSDGSLWADVRPPQPAQPVEAKEDLAARAFAHLVELEPALELQAPSRVPDVAGGVLDERAAVLLPVNLVNKRVLQAPAQPQRERPSLTGEGLEHRLDHGQGKVHERSVLPGAAVGRGDRLAVAADLRARASWPEVALGGRPVVHGDADKGIVRDGKDAAQG